MNPTDAAVLGGTLLGEYLCQAPVTLVETTDGMELHSISVQEHSNGIEVSLINASPKESRTVSQQHTEL